MESCDVLLATLNAKGQTDKAGLCMLFSSVFLIIIQYYYPFCGSVLCAPSMIYPSSITCSPYKFITVGVGFHTTGGEFFFFFNPAI